MFLSVAPRLVAGCEKHRAAPLKQKIQILYQVLYLNFASKSLQHLHCFPKYSYRLSCSFLNTTFNICCKDHVYTRHGSRSLLSPNSPNFAPMLLSPLYSRPWIQGCIILPKAHTCTILKCCRQYWSILWTVSFSTCTNKSWETLKQIY